MRLKQNGFAPLVAVVVAIVILSVAIGGVGIYLATRGGCPAGGENTDGGTTGSGILGATSLSYSVDITTGDQTVTSTYQSKNIGQSNFKLRIDGNVLGTETKVVFDQGENELWVWSAATGWQDVSGVIDFGTYTSLSEGYAGS